MAVWNWRYRIFLRCRDGGGGDDGSCASRSGGGRGGDGGRGRGDGGTGRGHGGRGGGGGGDHDELDRRPQRRITVVDFPHQHHGSVGWPEASGRARYMALALTQDRSNHWGLIMTMLAGWRKTWQKINKY